MSKKKIHTKSLVSYRVSRLIWFYGCNIILFLVTKHKNSTHR